MIKYLGFPSLGSTALMEVRLDMTSIVPACIDSIYSNQLNYVSN